MQFFTKLRKIINNIYLCLKYPFLYPRNRFTDLHYNNWKLAEYCDQLKDQSICSLYLISDKYSNSTEYIKNFNDNSGKIQCHTADYMQHGNYLIRVCFEDNVISIICWNTKRNRLKVYPINVKKGTVKDVAIIHKKEQIINGVPKDRYYITAFGKDLIDQNNVLSYEHVPIIINKWKCFLSNFLSKLHLIVFQFIFCIPTYTELDAMPKGWRKAFGIKMCNDIKKQLKKDKILYRWRIMDIKEKYGTLRLYYNYGSTELYDLIDQYERDSILYCIKCGKKAEYISKGWISPYCSNCKIGDNFVTISEYLKDDNS